MKLLLYLVLGSVFGSVITLVVVVIMGYLEIGKRTWKDDEDMER